MTERNTRLQLILTRACPLCHTVAIVRNLKGLEDAVSLSWVVGQPSQANDDMRWSAELALPAQTAARHPLPLLWDSSTGKVMTSDPLYIINYLNVNLNGVAKQSRLDLKPPSVAARVDDLRIFLQSRFMIPLHMLTCTTRQDVYEVAYRHAHAALFRLEQMLSRNRFLFGYRLTEGDCLAFPWLLRYDTVFRHLFKCSLTRVEDLPNLRNYVRELYQLTAIEAVTDLPAARQAYYDAYRHYDSTGILPLLKLDYHLPHNRAEIFPMPCCDKGVGQCKNHHVSIGEEDVAASSREYQAPVLGIKARTGSVKPVTRLIFRSLGLVAMVLLGMGLARKHRQLVYERSLYAQ